MTLDKAVSSQAVQSTLPDLGSNLYKAKLSIDNTREQFNHPRGSGAVREMLLDVAYCLSRHEKKADIWKWQYKKEDAHLLGFLVSRLRRKARAADALKHFEHSPVTSQQTSVNITSSPASRIEHLVDLLPELGHEDFEDLYYVVVCKLQELYRDLQVRFASGFLTLDHILHMRGRDCCSKNQPFTVRGMRSFIFSAWYYFHDQVFTYHIDQAIKDRKVGILVAAPLSPAHGVQFSPFTCTESITDMSVLRSTTRGLLPITSPATLLDGLRNKYGLNTYASEVCTLTPPISAQPLTAVYERDTVSLTDPKSSENGSTPEVKFDKYGNILTPLPCDCATECDCKFICNMLPDVCICRYRRSPLERSPHRLKPQFVLESPPRHRLRKSKHQSLSEGEENVPPQTCIGTPAKVKHCEPVSHIPAGGISSISGLVLPAVSMNDMVTSRQHIRYQPDIVTPPHTPDMQVSQFARAAIDWPTPKRHGNKPAPATKSNRPSPYKKGSADASPFHLAVSTNIPANDMSFRIPFEDNKFFASSPALLAPRPRGVRYVSAGGTLPVEERPQVTLPFSPTRVSRTGFTMQRAELLKRLPVVATEAPEKKLVRQTSKRASKIKDRITVLFGYKSTVTQAGNV